MTVLDGRYTVAGWLQNLGFIASFGLLGVGAALLFRTLVGRASSVALSDVQAKVSPKRDAAILAVAASLVVLAALVIPQATADRSCHNPLRDGWSVKSDLRMAPSFPWLQISLCLESGTQIFVQGLADQGEVGFGIYLPQGGEGWRSDLGALHRRIDARWPGKIFYRDGQGRQVAAPDWAKRNEHL